MPYSIFPLGDSALTVDFGNMISAEIKRKVIAFAQAIEKARWFAVKDIVPAYSSVTIHYEVIALLKQHKKCKRIYSNERTSKNFVISTS